MRSFLVNLGFIIISQQIILTSPCMLQEDCADNILSALEDYDERFNNLEAQYQLLQQDMQNYVRIHVQVLNLQIGSGPQECQKFLENAFDYYVGALNATCTYETVLFPTVTWQQYQQMPSNFWDSNSTETTESTCKILTGMAHYHCSQMRKNIESLTSCDYEAAFKENYVKPWLECIKTNHH